MDSPASFSVANINPGSVRTEFMLSVMALVEKERAAQHELDPLLPRIRFDQFYSHFTGPYLDVARNKCVLWYLEHTDSDFLLFVDSDIAFDSNDAFTLIQTAHEHGITLISGVYYNQFGPDLRALIYEWGDPAINGINVAELEPGARDMIAYTHDQITALTPSSKPHPVDGTGAGFLAIHRSVFTDMAPHYSLPQPFFADLCLGGIWMGEDLSFCVRAAHLGHRPHVLPSIILDHFKSCRITVPRSI